MKKLLTKILLLIVLSVLLLLLTACSNNDVSSPSEQPQSSSIESANENKKLTISDVITYFEQNNIEVNLEETKPYFTLVGAVDGEMFYLGEDPVKLYIFSDEKSYNQALKDYPILENMPKKDLIVIDTKSPQALDLFNKIR